MTRNGYTETWCNAVHMTLALCASYYLQLGRTHIKQCTESISKRTALSAAPSLELNSCQELRSKCGMLWLTCVGIQQGRTAASMGPTRKEYRMLKEKPYVTRRWLSSGISVCQFAVRIHCKITTFLYEPRLMLGVVLCFGEHCSCKFQAEYKYSPWRRQLQCLPKLWKTLNIQRGSYSTTKILHCLLGCCTVWFVEISDVSKVLTVPIIMVVMALMMEA